MHYIHMKAFSYVLKKLLPASPLLVLFVSVYEIHYKIKIVSVKCWHIVVVLNTHSSREVTLVTKHTRLQITRIQKVYSVCQLVTAVTAKSSNMNNE